MGVNHEAKLTNTLINYSEEEQDNPIYGLGSGCIHSEHVQRHEVPENAHSGGCKNARTSKISHVFEE